MLTLYFVLAALAAAFFAITATTSRIFYDEPVHRGIFVKEMLAFETAGVWVADELMNLIFFFSLPARGAASAAPIGRFPAA